MAEASVSHRCWQEAVRLPSGHTGSEVGVPDGQQPVSASNTKPGFTYRARLNGGGNLLEPCNNLTKGF